MKKFRPYKAGYLLLYGLSLLCVAEVVRSVIVILVEKDPNASSDPFMLWSVLIAVAAFFFLRLYIPTVVEISPKHIRVVRPLLITPKPGAKRAMFLLRQGNNDNVLSDRTFDPSKVTEYGYVEDLQMRPADQSGATPNNKLFPLHEVAFVLSDGKNYRLNAPIYTKKQRMEMFRMIREITNVEPTGTLKDDIERGFVPVKNPADKAKKKK